MTLGYPIISLHVISLVCLASLPKPIDPCHSPFFVFLAPLLVQFFVCRFRKDLADAVEQVDANNLSRDMHHQYRALDPSVMPNYPGI